MSTLPDALTHLSKQLSIPSEEWWEHDADYYLGFFRRGHPTVRRFRYWRRDGVIRGLTIRGMAIGTTDWLADPAWAELEDLLFIDTDITSLTVPPKIKRLDLSDCKQLTQLRFTGDAIPLTDLFAQRSGIENITFPKCPALRCLHLRSCPQLRKVEFAEPPTGLGVLELEACPALEELPAAAIRQEELFYLDARGTTPRNCPAVFTDTEKLSQEYLPRIRAWFRALEEGSQPNRYVKLLINGNGDVGKTTLWCALKNQEEDRCTCTTDHGTTHGIDLTIEPLDVGEVHFRGWDFGGQETYHGTHQLFFADESINILVTDYDNERKALDREEVADRKGQKTLNHPIEYFYERQKQRDRNGYFVLVQSKDDGSGSIHPKVRELKQKHNFPLFQVDSKAAPDAVDDLRTKIVNLTKRHLKIWGMPFPAAWLKVRKKLAENLAKPTIGRVISATKFREWAIDNCGLSNDEVAYEALLQFLHAAGDLYRIGGTEDAELILDMRWALEGIYRPLDRADFAARARSANGRVFVRDLFQSIRSSEYSYTEAELKILLDFMLNCGICFVGDRENYRYQDNQLPVTLIFPQYLPREMNQKIRRGWDRTDQVTEYRARLPYRDITALHALLSELGRKAQEDHIWYYGIDLDLVDANDEEGKPPLPDGHVLIELDAPVGATTAPELVVKLDEEAGGLAWWPSVKDWIDNKFNGLQWQETAMVRENAKVITPADVKDSIGLPVAVWLQTYLAGKELNLDGELSAVMKALARRAHMLLKPDTIGTYFEAKEFIKATNPTIVHFLGHANAGELEFLADSGQGGKVYGPNEMERFFKVVLETCEDLRVVLLNACFTEGLAQMISRSGLYVVGTEKKLSDQGAVKFSQSFYVALIADKKSAEEAFVTGRIAAWEVASEPRNYLLFHGGKNITPQWKEPGR